MQGLLSLIFSLYSNMQAYLNRRVLPPGIEDDVVFGIMWIRVGSLKSSKMCLPIHSVTIKFWGETTPAKLTTSSQNPQTQQYEIRCPITLFQKYVQDMKKSLQIEVEGLGLVSLDLSAHLKTNITLATKSPFDHFKGFFEVKGKDQKKVASLQLEICANFSPEVAQRELGEAIEHEVRADQIEHPANKQQMRSSPKGKRHQISKPSNQKQIFEGQCEITQLGQNRQHIKVNALDILAVEKPELFREFYEESKSKVTPRASKPIYNVTAIDQRIPNSLNIQPNKAVFEPQKYEQVATPPAREAFPMVQKVLTYSNLRLEKDEEEGLISPPAQPDRSSRTSKGLKKEEEAAADKKASFQQEPRPDTKLSMEKPEQSQPLPKKQQSKEQRGDKPTASKQPHQPFSVGENKRQPSLSEVSQVNKINDSVSVEARREILSRVIHLDEELQKDKIRESQKKIASRPLAQISAQPISLNRNFPNFQIQTPINFAKPKGKKSSLLLSMMIEIERGSIKLPKSRFTIRFRPYGERQFVRLGPQLDKIVTLMFPVGESQVLKMAKMPFILQFWGTGEQEFIGMIKIQLAKVYKGYVLDGRLNQLAIKTSLLPTVIHKGNILVKDLKEQPCGECHLSAHIGTSLQLQTYLSAPKSQPLQVPQALTTLDIQGKQEPTPKSKGRAEGNLQDFTNFLEMLVNDSQACKAAFTLCQQQSYLSQADLAKLFEEIQFKGGDPFRLMEDQERISCLQMSLCYQDCSTVKKQLSRLVQGQISALSSKCLSELKQRVRSQSRLGLISKQSLLRMNQIKQFLPFTSTVLPEIVEEEPLLKTLSNPTEQLSQLYLSPQACQTIILKIFIQGSHLLDLQKMLSLNATSPLVRLQQVRAELLKAGGKKYSKWFWLQLAQALYKAHREIWPPRDQNINIVLLYNWLLVSERQRKRQEQGTNEKRQVDIVKDYSQREEVKHIQEQQLQQPQRNTIALQQKQAQSAAKLPAAESDKSPRAKHQPQQKSKEEISSIIYQHKFLIGLQQLQLQQPEQGNCIISYQFPLQPEKVEAKAVKVIADKHAYKLHSIATHTLTLSGSLESHLAENPLQLTVQLPSHQLTGHLHPAELIPETPTLKAIPLFHPEHSGIAGKVKLTVSYTRRQTSRAIGSQTTQELFLPKSGYLNYSLESQIDPGKIKQQLSLPPQFYLQLWLDPFGSNPSLVAHYPPVYSALISDFSSSVMLSGSYKVTLTPTVLEHFKGGSWTSKAVVIYYQKSRGNYERRQVVIGSCTAPLLPAIRREGLVGDYAFKNKIGMFVALGSVSLHYQKKSHIQTGKHLQIEKTNYWIILDFAEVINFQRDLGWIKFEVVSNGKRISTDKTYLKQLGFHNLAQRCLLLHLPEEEMASFKILPIKVLTASKQFAIDINLRPTAKQLQSHSHHAEAQYLLAVDQHSQTAKLRIGVKAYAFKGTSMVAPLVEAIANNPPRLNIDLPSLSNQTQSQHRQMLQQLRKILKLSSSSFENILQRLLDRSKRQKLSTVFFTSIMPILDLTPIFSNSEEEVQQIGQELPSEVPYSDFLEYLKENSITLGNLRKKSLERYSFSRINSSKFDQNIEHLGLHQEVDLLVFLKKIKIQPANDESQIQPEEQHQNGRELKITLIRGFDFHLLYNGIKPNPLLKLPQLSFTTQAYPRTSEPIFNSSITFALPKTSVDIAIQAYHAPGAPTQQILIGQGTISINENLDRQKNSFNKTYRIVLHSAMSNRLQAAVDVKLELSNRDLRGREEVREVRELGEGESLQDSIEDEQIEQALNRIKKNDYGTKGAFFESSDQQY